ncbi:MAG: phage head morphogenesis protein [Elusimicrobia bacterium]|nr:phage head morphogenesis protein [Elusimicrobiota bacterium]
MAIGLGTNFTEPYGAPIALDVRPHRHSPSTRASAGIAAHYRRRLEDIADELNQSVIDELLKIYRRGTAVEDLMAADAAPDDLRRAVERLRSRWFKKLDRVADRLAEHFGKSVVDRSDEQLKKVLRNGGISVKFQMGAPARDVLKSVVAENVSLIRSIPEQYLTQVEGAVMRSVAAGRDLKSLSDELQYQFGVTKRRAALIARDQNNKATGAIQQVRLVEAGIYKALWRHSMAGKVPRPTHLANDGNEYDVRRGWWDPAERQWIYPGYLINCRCWAQPILPR